MDSNNKAPKRKPKVLIGSPIRQASNILKHFLESLDSIYKNDIIADYFFIDDNDEILSQNLLKDFNEKSKEKVIIQKGNKKGKYVCNENTHHWKESLIWKVADYKNIIIDYCKKNNYDYLFLIDSDIVLHPKTLEHLISTKKDIISEIFWTKWHPESQPLPQIWLYDQYSLIKKGREEKLTEEEAAKRFNSFIQQLKEPGIYEVGGLGACTLISKNALDNGVNYSEIYNVSFWGEDRHFSIRAASLGFKLFVDTTYPAYHIYRQSDIEGVEKYKKEIRKDNSLDISSFENSSVESNIINTVKEFIEKFYSCDYRVVTGFEALKYLSSYYTGKMTKTNNEIIKYLIDNKVKVTASLLNLNIVEFDEKKAQVKARFVISDRERQRIFSCSLNLMKNRESKWLINFISLKNDKDINILGYSLDSLLKEKERIAKSKDNKLTLMMLVRNEENKFLNKVLSHAAQYIDNAVILDDASEDNTVRVCKNILKNKLVNIVSNKVSSFENEVSLRKQLWKITEMTNPDWILCLDADEIFEDKIIDYIHPLINQSEFDYYGFRLYDMWNESHYREDTYWTAHKYYRMFLIRYQPNFDYIWNETPQHCGRFPKNINKLNGCQCNLRLKHYGWSNEALRIEKYNRYMKLDPKGKYGSMNQYRTILDKNPRLIKWDMR
ncbi:glycosyltransferase [Paramaledivibacter caminithermalis]|uniref:Anp1 protein n=1 Tax=Paramaledivibacter caminithermalis (strain DSM 15212 / CIP 107654 / DViRD3) TaxID=1121301 RepID=A0A1M6LZF2_PARC5|nr:glycosyltransferase [Paramaledivibacter caminithermalis]SHJ76616.1 Anp1 protein [Paramaledivibacter caminithermalis DSM 15212]